MNKRSIVIRYFTSYFRLIAREAGVRWDSDNDAEIQFAVESIIDAVVEEEIEPIKKQIKAILEAYPLAKNVMDE